MNRHPIEDLFNAPAWDILTAIQHGFRARVDVKGKLAEYYLSLQLAKLREAGWIEDIQWQDKDGQPDFLVKIGGRILCVECKNVRSPQNTSHQKGYRVELQKTRNSRDGTPTRRYRMDEFDVLSVCLFNQIGKWEYLHIATKYLICDKDLANCFVIMQRVPFEPEAFWRLSIADAIRDALGEEKVG